MNDTNAKCFILRNSGIRDNALQELAALPLNPVLMEVIIRPYEKTRSLGQNSRYWASVTEYMRQIDAVIKAIEEYTGYDQISVRRHLAGKIQFEYGLILAARKPEVVHEVLKEICNVPTSTKLGTKAFIDFEERMLAVLSEVISHAQAMLHQAQA